MTELQRNTALVEEFGRLEKLCGDLCGEHHGVTCYINEMREKRSQGQRAVPHWEATLRRLTDIRHKRNQLSHGEVPFHMPCATDADLQFLQAFFRQILERQDPLTLLNRANRTRPSHCDTTPCQNRKSPVPLTVALLLIVILTVLFLLLTMLFWECWPLMQQ